MKKLLWIWLLLLPSLVHAQEAKDQGEDAVESGRPHEHRQENWGRHRWGRFQAGGGFVVRYIALESARYASAFTTAGLSAPSDGGVLWGGIGYLRTESGWYFGGAGYATGVSRNAGASLAEVSYGYGGFYLGKDLYATNAFDISLNAVVGGGGAELTVFGPTKSGRYSEGFFAVEPQLTAAFKAARWMKVGATVAYLYTAAPSTEAVGSDLGVSRLSRPMWSAGAQLVFGFFGDGE